MNATEEQLDFLRRNRLVIVGVNRAGKAPHLTPVYYVVDEDGTILMSTTASRYKAKAVRRDPNVSLCVLGEQFPFPYLMIEGTARVEEDGAVDLMMRIGERMTGQPVPEPARPAVEQRARDEGRVVLRVTPERFRSTTPLAAQRE